MHADEADVEEDDVDLDIFADSFSGFLLLSKEPVLCREEALNFPSGGTMVPDIVQSLGERMDVGFDFLILAFQLTNVTRRQT